MAVPTVSTEWASDVTAIKSEPGNDLKQKGWDTSDGTTAGVPDKPTLPEDNQWKANVHEWLQWAQAEILDSANSVFNVGSVQKSMLTDVQFQALQVNADWVLMDGQDVTGSEYHTLTGSTTVPDASGLFIRAEGGNSGAIGAVQSDGTFNDVTGTAAGQTYSASVNSEYSTHTHQKTLYGWEHPTGGTNDGTAWTTQNIGWPKTNDTGSDSHNHTVVINHTHAASSLSINTSDIETAPINLAVNYFIKIN